jgi:hypothetical protein
MATSFDLPPLPPPLAATPGSGAPDDPPPASPSKGAWDKLLPGVSPAQSPLVAAGCGVTDAHDGEPQSAKKPKKKPPAFKMLATFVEDPAGLTPPVAGGEAPNVSPLAEDHKHVAASLSGRPILRVVNKRLYVGHYVVDATGCVSNDSYLLLVPPPYMPTMESPYMNPAVPQDSASPMPVLATAAPRRSPNTAAEATPTKRPRKVSSACHISVPASNAGSPTLPPDNDRGSDKHSGSSPHFRGSGVATRAPTEPASEPRTADGSRCVSPQLRTVAEGASTTGWHSGRVSRQPSLSNTMRLQTGRPAPPWGSSITGTSASAPRAAWARRPPS